jgi:hypothetical protein
MIDIIDTSKYKSFTQMKKEPTNDTFSKEKTEGGLKTPSVASEIIEIKGILITTKCPFCNKKHRHGTGYLKPTLNKDQKLSHGYRVAGCNESNGNEYELIYSKTTKTDESDINEY